MEYYKIMLEWNKKNCLNVIIKSFEFYKKKMLKLHKKKKKNAGMKLKIHQNSIKKITGMS